MAIGDSMSELEVRVICCNSYRTCNDYYTGVIDVIEKTFKRYKAVRCYRGIERTLKITEPDRYIVFHNQVSNRGIQHIQIVHKPSFMSEEEAMRIIREVIGLVEVEVL
jgi:hypothetical protein